MSTVSIRNLDKHYGALHVLKDINLNVEEGAFTVFLGPSGCGKSTLLSAVAGLDDVSSGDILIDGKSVLRIGPDKRGIAMVFQSYALYPTMSVRRNMAFGLQVARLPKADIDRRVADAAEMLQITPLLDRKPGQLSGGQRQRVAIGRALVRQSRLFLFDEPLSNLDAKLRTEMRVEIKRLHQSLGATMLYVTHDQVEAMTMATRIAVMKAGRVEQYAAPEEVYRKPTSLFVAGFVGSPAMNFLEGKLVKENGTVLARLPGGDVDLAQYAFSTKPQDGQPVVLGIRPENISIVGDGASGDIRTGITAPLLLLEPLGADTLAWFEVEGRRLSVRLHPQQARALSGAQQLHFDPTELSLFSLETEARL
jgi:multiple sugar transport system ATP-binding protein